MDKQTLTDRFLAWESEFELFDVTPSRVRIWEWLRFYTYRRFLESGGVVDEVHTDVGEGPAAYLKGLYLWAKNGLRRNPYFADQHDFLFVGHPRRKQLEDGYWWDLYCDPIHAETDLDYLHLERPYNLSHLRPARTKNLRYLDLVLYSGEIADALGIVDDGLDSRSEAILREAGRAGEERFGNDPALVERAVSRLRRRAVLKPMYDRLLSIVDPDVAVVLVSYDNETFIEACKESDVPVVELQHGLVHDHHMGYSYPGDRTKRTFPDYFFSFGEFWNDQAEFPIPGDRVIPVGYPYLERQAARYESLRSGRSVVFISNGPVGKRLSKFAVEFADRNPRSDVVYKLHPGEYDRWREMYPWLVGADVTVVDSDTPPLYRLFAEASAQVGVLSTALYEGLHFDLDTFILDEVGSAQMEAVVTNGDATMIESVDQLSERLQISRTDDVKRSSVESHRYFLPNAVENVRMELESVRQRGRPEE